MRCELFPTEVGGFSNSVQFMGNADPDNEISLTAFRLCTMDMLELFKVMNEGTINVLGVFGVVLERPRLTMHRTLFRNVATGC